MTATEPMGDAKEGEARDFAPKASGHILALMSCRLRTWVIINE